MTKASRQFSGDERKMMKSAAMDEDKKVGKSKGRKKGGKKRRSMKR